MKMYVRNYYTSSPEEVLAIIYEADDEVTKEEEAEAEARNKLQLQNNHLKNRTKPYVLAVTACPNRYCTYVHGT